MVAHFTLHRALVLNRNDADQGRVEMELLQDVQLVDWMGWCEGGLGITLLGLSPVSW